LRECRKKTSTETQFQLATFKEKRDASHMATTAPRSKVFFKILLNNGIGKLPVHGTVPLQKSTHSWKNGI